MSAPPAIVILLWNALLDSDPLHEILQFFLYDWVGGEVELITIDDIIQQLVLFHSPLLLSPSFLPHKKKKETTQNFMNVDPTDHMQKIPLRQPRTLLLGLMSRGRHSDSTLFCLGFESL